jgi:hypothetical protein
VEILAFPMGVRAVVDALEVPSIAGHAAPPLGSRAELSRNPENPIGGRQQHVAALAAVDDAQRLGLFGHGSRGSPDVRTLALRPDCSRWRSPDVIAEVNPRAGQKGPLDSKHRGLRSRHLRCCYPQMRCCHPKCDAATLNATRPPKEDSTNDVRERPGTTGHFDAKHRIPSDGDQAEHHNSTGPFWPLAMVLGMVLL